MTSAHITNFNIFKKDTGEKVGEHSEHALCVSRYSRLLSFFPLKDYIIQPWGYDEEEEYWEGEKQGLALFMRNKIKPPQSLFFVKVYEEMTLNSPSRNIGWWCSEYEAKIGLKNFGDECRWSYAIIEELGYGLHPQPISAKWFICNHNSQWLALKDADQFEITKCINHCIG